MLLLSSMCSVHLVWFSLYRPACDQPIDRQQDYGAQGRYENGPKAYLGYPWAPEEGLDYETAYECSRYTDQDGDNDPPGVRSWHNPLGQHAGYEPDHYQRYDAYALSPPPRMLLDTPRDTRQRNITDALPHATFAVPHPRHLRHKHRPAYGFGRLSGERALQSRPHEGEN